MVVKDGVYWWTREGLVSRGLREGHLVAAMGLRMIVREGVGMVGAERRELLGWRSFVSLYSLSLTNLLYAFFRCCFNYWLR